MNEHMNTIAVIEDSTEIRQSLIDLLEMNGYKGIQAEDGEKGWELIRNEHPDLIISDIMMPNMDGYQMLQKLKSDAKLKHIPVIFLTARVLLSDKLQGLEFGANDYITKPFEIKELLLKVKNLLEFRDHTLTAAYSNPKKLNVESKDDRFLREVNLAIESKINDVDLGLQEMASILGISTSSLQKKIKKITNKSVSQYIREYRLKRSNDLIMVKYGSLSEIAQKTGFRSLSYFSKSFKDYYGISPSSLN